ncbi:MAG: DEAD/DEAH box helicase [Planctomycetes bacterium]|nr:DEAD/DEAH box helicase [Planctomycetota bacterium]
MAFKSLGLCDPLVQGILATGYTAPTEIQSQAIPAAIEGRDIIGCAQTGTGKTAAFVLPILNRLHHKPATAKKAIRSLILTPTRELAVQIEQCIVGYGRFLHFHTLAIYGGVNIEGQLRALRRGVDIVVATPGRLLDHIQRRSIDLKSVEVLVLDEADRMFDMGFIKDVRKIIAAVPQHRQTMLFSATMSSEVKTLASGVQKSPKMIQIGQQRNPIETITQHIYPVRKDQKMDLLQQMLARGKMDCVLVFSRTKHGADKISHRLERAGIRSVAIHSNRSQSQRQRAMDGFKAGKFQVMVATDIAARGIDVEGISHVVNFDVPAFAEDYIHRIGRTGRATATGDAITFVSNEEQKYFHQIEKFIGRRLPMENCPEFVRAKPEAAQPLPHSDVYPAHASVGRAPSGGSSGVGKKPGGFRGWHNKRPRRRRSSRSRG